MNVDDDDNVGDVDVEVVDDVHHLDADDVDNCDDDDDVDVEILMMTLSL